MNSEPILDLQRLSKIYPGVVALKDVSLTVNKGEVHALVGENGAGKSTMVKICSGAIIPNGGNIYIDGDVYTSLSPILSEKLGIAVIYQEFNLVNELTVAENVFLGRAIRKGIVVDLKSMVERTTRIFRELHINIDPYKKVGNLTVGYQQMVEIAKALSMDAKILIMDEPSAPLTNAEVKDLYRIVRQLKENGVTIVYISHRLEEIFELSDRITILRDGEKIKTLETRETDTKELIELMVGRKFKETFPLRDDYIENETILDVENISGNGVHDISFNIKRGEILGFGGLVGAGRTELAELIFGTAPLEAGIIRMHGKKLDINSPKKAIRQGIAYVPEDRKAHGILEDINLRENISVTVLQKLSKLSVINRKKEKAVSARYCNELHVKAPNMDVLVKALSGGNQQKVVLAKWLATEPDLIILDEPTRGIDVGAKYEIYKLINQLVAEGKAVMMISSEMEELIGMSDRIIVLSEGYKTGELKKQDFNQEKILEYASINSGGVRK